MAARCGPWVGAVTVVSLFAGPGGACQGILDAPLLAQRIVEQFYVR